MTKRVRFSYRAKSRSILAELEAFAEVDFDLEVEDEYASIFLELSLWTS